MEHYFTNNENLKSELRDIKFNFEEYNFVFKSDNGVFSKNKIDYASLFLVKTFLAFKNNNYNKILDVGCGYGFIGITLSKVLNKNVDMIDINKRAIHLCEMNINLNQVQANVFLSDGFSNISQKYDLIISNPPIRVGKEILLKILKDALSHLNENGELWFVINKDQGAKSIKKELEKLVSCEIIDKSKGFLVICAKN